MPSSSAPPRPSRHPLASPPRLRLFPLQQVLRNYSAALFRADLKAALNVALLAIPQGMACAKIAGLPVAATGIACAAIGSLVGPLFAHSRHTNLGPTNATALMAFSSLASFAAPDRPSLLVLLTLMASAMLLLGAALRMADLIQYISRSVIVGYISGAALLIIAAQLPDALGIDPAHRSHQAQTFPSLLAQSLGNLAHSSGPDLLLSACSLLLFTLLSRQPSLQKLPCFALTLALMAALAALLQARGFHVHCLQPFALRDLAPSLPNLTAPSTADHISRLLGPAFAIAFLAALEHSVMTKSLASRSGDRPDLNQDLLGCGMANLGSACFGGLPVSGSLTRSLLNFTSGARTPISSLLCGLFCLAGALLLGRVVSFIPQAALAALIIALSLSLINRDHLRICLRATRADALTLSATFLATLLMPLHVAIFLGVATSIVLYLRQAARPSLVEYDFTPEGSLTERPDAHHRSHPAISIVHVEGELFFGAAELFRSQIQQTAADPNLRLIILRLKNARHLDATSVLALQELTAFLRQNGRNLLISGLSKDVYRVLKNADMVDFIGRENLFIGSAQNPNLSTRNALKRAQSLLGSSQADIRIFYDPSQPSPS